MSHVLVLAVLASVFVACQKPPPMDKPKAIPAVSSDPGPSPSPHASPPDAQPTDAK